MSLKSKAVLALFLRGCNQSNPSSYARQIYNAIPNSKIFFTDYRKLNEIPAVKVLYS